MRQMCSVSGKQGSHRAEGVENRSAVRKIDGLFVVGWLTDLWFDLAHEVIDLVEDHSALVAGCEVCGLG